MDAATMAPHLNDTIKSEFLTSTRKFWQGRAPRQLTDEDARQIIANVAGAFALLAEWDAKQKLDEAVPSVEIENCNTAGGTK